MSSHISNVRPKPDQVLVDIADYASKFKIKSAEAYDTARLVASPAAQDLREPVLGAWR